MRTYAPAEVVAKAADGRQLGGEPVDDRHGRILVKIVDDEDLVRLGDRRREHPEHRLDRLAFLEHRHHDRQHRRGHQSRPASVSSRIHGMTSSSIWSRLVVASKPRTSRDLRTSGTRSWTSCSNGGSLTNRNGRPSVWILCQIASASSSTVVDAAVDRLKSSLTAAGDSIARRMPWARSPP